MPSPTSLVENLRPVSRVQTQLKDQVLRAGIAAGTFAYRGAEILRFDMGNYQSFTVARTGIGINISIEGSNDGENWTPLEVRSVGRYSAPFAGNNIGMNSSGTTIVGGAKQTRFVRLVALGAESGGTTCAITAVLSQSPLPDRPAAIDLSDAWTYVAASGGVTNSTPVTVRASTGTNYTRNYVRAIDVSNGGATGTEVRLVDGTQTLWRAWLGPGATLTRDFGDRPLRAALDATNGGISLSLSAASGAAVYANVSGFAGI